MSGGIYAEWNHHIMNDPDGKKKSWSNFTICNPPYDEAILFMVKSLESWRKEKNIDLILPRWFINGNFLKIYSAQ